MSDKDDRKLKSGYIRDVAPDRVDALDKEAVPIAGGKGGQLGRPAPVERKYRAGIYEQVSAEEASMRRVSREAGKVAKIKGGLDDNQVAKQAASQAAAKRAAARQPSADEAEPGFVDADRAGEFQGGFKGDDFNAPPPRAAPDAPIRDAIMNNVTAYLKKCCRVSLEMADGTMGMSAIAVIPTMFSVTVLVPMTDEGTTFTPKPGSEVRITHGEKCFECFYPGANFQAPELGMMGLVFIKKQE